MVPISFLYPLYMLSFVFQRSFLFIIPRKKYILSDASADPMILEQYISKPEKWSLQFLKR